MTGPQPPLPENWPTQPPSGGFQTGQESYQIPPQGYPAPPGSNQGYQVPPDGYQVPQQGYPALGPPGPPSAPRSNRRLAWIIAAIIIVGGFVGVGIFAMHVLPGDSRGGIVLPAHLIGLEKDTSADANGVARALIKAEIKGAGKTMKNVKAGVYGIPSGVWFAIVGGGICGTCAPKSAAEVIANFRAAGYTKAASFPSGPNGGILVCGSKPEQGGGLLFRCSWVDDRTEADVLYSDGEASAIDDAATSTNSLRSVVER